MNSEEKKIALPRGELKDEGLEEVSGGYFSKLVLCRCPTCQFAVISHPGVPCARCADKGVESYMVEG